MGAEQEAIARSGVGTAADEALGRAGSVGQDGGAGTTGVGGAGAGNSSGLGGENGDGTGSSSSSRSDAEELAAATVQGCNDLDKVARQLCEAATQEADPFLRAALWDEYNQYRTILARQ
jgi:hypothetical protein